MKNKIYPVVGTFLIAILLFGNLGNIVQAQCTIYPVRDAVINGDFEGPVGLAAPTEFQLDGFWPGATMANQRLSSNIVGSCYYSTANAYYINSVIDTFYCESVKKIGFGFCPGCFQITGDHTPGKAGKGKFLAVDTWYNATPGTRISPVGSAPIVWQQTVTVSPGQLYYFSAWAANWGPTPYADLRFFVQGNNDAVPVQLGSSPFTVPSSTWTQFNQTWNSNLNTTAVITIRNQTSNALFGNDFALDDISFINSCQNVSSAPYAPNLGPDLSLCYNQGSITLNSNTATNAPSRGFTWYTGTGTAQSVFVPLSNTQNTLTVTTSGTYRVCVFESGQCAVSSSITINKNMTVDLGPDKSLCNPASALLNTGYPTPDPTISYLWKKGTTTISSGINTPSYLANSAGVYTVSLTSSVVGCGPVSDNVTLTSNLPTPGTGYTYCDPSNKNVTMTVAGSGTYNWYTTSVGGTSLGSGTSYAAVITGTGTKTFYVDDVSTTALANTSWASGSSQFGNGHNLMRFNLATGVQIVSVKAISQGYQGSCGAGGSAASVVIRLLQNGVTVPGYQTTFNFTCGGTHTIPIGFNIPAGNNYDLEYTGDGYFQWYPCYSGCPGAINYRPNSSIAILYDQTGQSGGALFDWVVNQVPGCARVPITVTQNCPTPISLVDFEGQRTSKGNKIKWQTSSEENNDHFELEKSYDGQSFTTIANIKGANNSNTLINYEWLDADYSNSSIYYRLKQVDYSGAFSFSKLILLKSSLSLNYFSVYPVPSTGNIIIKLESQDEISPNLQIFDQLGILVSNEEIPSFIGSKEIQYSIAELPIGVYSLRIKDETGIQIRKIIKE